jgi:hypothetical protein
MHLSPVLEYTHTKSPHLTPPDNMGGSPPCLSRCLLKSKLKCSVRKFPKTGPLLRTPKQCYLDLARFAKNTVLYIQDQIVICMCFCVGKCMRPYKFELFIFTSCSYIWRSCFHAVIFSDFQFCKCQYELLHVSMWPCLFSQTLLVMGWRGWLGFMHPMRAHIYERAN